MLKLQYFGHLMWRADSLEKTLILGNIEGRSRRNDREWDGWWHHRLDGHESEQALGVGNAQWSLVCCSPWGRGVRHDWVTESRTNLRDLVEFARRCSFLGAEQGNVTRWGLSQLSLTQLCFLLLLFSCSVASNSATPWMAACQVTLSFTISQNLLKFMSIESVMLPHLVKITDTSDIAVVFYFGLLGNHDFYSLSHSALG